MPNYNVKSEKQPFFLVIWKKYGKITRKSSQWKDAMNRQSFLKRIKKAFSIHPVVGIIGPRQCGKTTLARMYANHGNGLPPENYFDLEDLEDLARLESPKAVLSQLSSKRSAKVSYFRKCFTRSIAAIL